MANNTQPNTPPKPADASDSVNKTDDNKGGKEAGGGESTPLTSIDELPQELLDEINRRMASARREGEEKGKSQAKTEDERKAEEARQAQLESEKQFQPLYEQEKGKREDAEKRASAAERKLLALEVALKTKLPNPHEIYKRLQGDTEDDLVTDAKALLKVLKSDAVADDTDKSKDDSSKGKGKPPAVTSSGGDSDSSLDLNQVSEDDKVRAQRSSNAYNW